MNNDLVGIQRKLASNTFYLFLDYFAVSVLSLLFWSSTGKFLLPADYGVVSISINFVSFTGLLGLSFTLTKLFPEYIERNQIDKLKELIKFCILEVLLASIIIISFFLILSPHLYKSVEIPISMLIIVSVCLLLSSFSQIVLGILAGYQNMRGLFVTDVISNISKLFLSILLMVLGFNYLGPVIGFGVGALLILILRFKLLSNLDLFKLSNLLTIKGLDKKYIFSNYAIPSFVISISTILLTSGQITILGLLKGPAITGIFSVAFVLSNIIVMIFRVMSRALLPITSQLSARKNLENTQGYFINMVLRYGLLISIPILIAFTLFSDRLILIFSRGEYITASALIPILSLASILYGVSIVLNTSIYAIGKPKIQRNIAIISSLIFLLLAFPLTYMFSAEGMAYSYLIYAIISAVFGIYNLRKYLKIKLHTSFIKIVISGCITFILLSFFLLISQNTLEKFMLTISSVIIYVLILIFSRFVNSDDVRVLKFLVARLPVFKKQLNYIIDKIPKTKYIK